MFLGPNGQYRKDSNHEGYRAVGVPGTVAGFDLALKRFGTRSWNPLAAPAVKLAEEGFSPVRGYHHYVSMARKNLREHLYGERVRYKKYLYVLRPLLAARWIREGRGVPPMRFAELASKAMISRW